MKKSATEQLVSIFRLYPDIVYELKDELKFLSPFQYKLYCHLRDGEGNTSTSLAELTGANKKTVATALKSMVTMGVICRKPNDDRWEYIYETTLEAML